MTRYVIEISAIAEADSDEVADEIGRALCARVELRKLTGRQLELLRRVESVTVANLDADFLTETG